jgi:hypothetical protein
MNALKLFEITAQFHALENISLTDELPQEVIRDTLEGLTGTFNEKAVAVAKFVLSLEANSAAIVEAAAAMKARASAVQRRADNIRAYLQFQMQSVDILRIETPELILRRQSNPPSVNVTDEVAIPEKFWVQPPAPPPRLDKVALKKALQAGERVDGAYIENAERLEIKI